MYPETRMRRYRRNEKIRRMLKAYHLHAEQLIYPIFVVAGEDKIEAVDSMPGVYRFSLDHLLEEVKRAVDAGVQNFILFGIPAEKDEVGSGAYAEDGIVQEALRLIRANYPDVAKTAVSQAAAGADIIAPSDMMDGRIAALRDALDDAGYEDVAIMSYAAKFASAFYGPFRDAGGSAPQFGDRKTYQMDPACSIEQAVQETELDVQEGADYIIVKPAMAYLDIMRMTQEQFLQPVVAYQVSGEYAMIKAAAQNDWIDERRIVEEVMTGFLRAGAQMIITYYAIDLANWLKED